MAVIDTEVISLNPGTTVTGSQLPPEENGSPHCILGGHGTVHT